MTNRIILPKREIQEWDGSVSTVSVSTSPNGDTYYITYSDGHTHIVTKQYLDSITLRTYAP